MEKLIHFDICALLLLFTLLISTVMRRMTKGLANQMFLVILSTMLTATAFDIWAITLDNSGTADYTFMYIAHTGYLFFHNLTPPAYVLYVISLSDTWHKLKKNPIQIFLIVIPFLLVFGMLIANFFSHSLFTIENHMYIRKELFAWMYISSIYYITLGLVYLFCSHKLLSKIKIASISAMMPLLIIAVIVQFFYPTFIVEMFSGAISALIISMTAQRPEEILDARTKQGNYGAYADDVKRAFATEKNISIIMLNVGNYPSIQSMFTYDSNVMLLRTISDEITKICKIYRGYYEIYYLDRGRFRIVLSHGNKSKATEIANMLYTALKSNISINNLSIDILPRFCVVNCPEDISDFTTLMAFGANFHERAQNTDSVLQASELFRQEKFDISNNIDLIIEKAIQNNSFEVYYQPIFSIEKNKFSTAEALLRLKDDEYGFVPPNLFIPAAEKSGAIHKIGDFVLEEVCKFIGSKEFKDLGLEYIEINLSVAQCMHSDLADKILKTMKKYNIPSDKINLEITETAVSFGKNTLRSNLDKLTEAGVSFSLDDYGTGYSNMRRVIQLPLKIVKLDKSFVDEQNNPKMWIVLQNTVKMLKDMNMEIVVEGIETENMVDKFTDLNCDYIQGYYYSKPIPKSDFVEFIKKAHAPTKTS